MPLVRSSAALVGSVAVSALVVVAGAGTAAAHAALVGASPAPCDVVVDVTQVVVDFDQPIAADLSELVVVDGDDAVVAAGEVVSDSLLGATMAADVPEPLPPGDYRVAWRNVSAVDSDPDQGVYGFTVGGDGAVAASGCSHVGGAGLVLSADAGLGAPLVVILAVGVVAVGALALLAVLRRRPSAAS